MSDPIGAVGSVVGGVTGAAKQAAAFVTGTTVGTLVNGVGSEIIGAASSQGGLLGTVAGIVGGVGANQAADVTWGKLNPKLIANFFACNSAGSLNAGEGFVNAPITDANIEFVMNWQSPFESVGPESKAPALMWTVEERGAVIAHYLAHTIGPTFSIGDTGTFPDYLYAGQTTAEETYIGPVGDDEWHLSPLLGYQAEAIERVILGQRVELPDGSGKLVGRVGWIIGAMACQLRRTQEEPLEDIGADEFDEWLEERMAFLLAYGDNDSADLREAFMAARFTQRHLLNAHFNDEGVVFVSEVPGRPSARFPVSDLLSERTARFLGVAA